ncbi:MULTISPECIES: hypothetical protein [Microbulbifer]|uniref:hypothetical protein n=1 Tax=Microbulbifer TaxID=48073 RepID=UPI001E4EFA99|nr:MULTISPECIES: hypothetical protein [Microbulbifer]UHQ54039.1 hypothetical protein LVE68_10980 [Microbulbifer sp. YPW16]
MKKILACGGLLLAGIIAFTFIGHYREVREEQREQTAQLLARCVNESLLSLFRLQANEWRDRPDLYRDEAARLSKNVAALPQRLSSGEDYPEWREAVLICEQFTEHTNAQHRTIFRPLAAFAELPVGDNRLLGDRRELRQLRRRLASVEVSARAADRYLQDMQRDIAQLVNDSGLSAATRQAAEQQINSEVLDRYRRGAFSLKQVLAHTGRVHHYYKLLAGNPRGWTLRAGGLYFHDRALRSEVDQLNSAVFQGEGQFYANWKQVLQRQQ